MAALTAILVGLLAALCWTHARRPKAEPTTGARDVQDTPAAAGDATLRQPFACVRVRLGPQACAAARALAQQTFLMNDAPALPHRDCRNERCKCSYVKLSDRRGVDSRRWADEGLEAPMFASKERRSDSGRREGD